MEKVVQDNRIRVSVAGSIAEAAADITQIFSTAQRTADLYLYEIAAMKEDAEKECAAMIKEAQKKVEAILSEGEQQLAALNDRYKAEQKKYQLLKTEMQWLEDRKSKG